MSINLFQIWNHFCRDSNLVPPGITTLFDTRLEYSALEEVFGKISKFVLIISEYNWFQERDIFKSKLCWWEIKFGTHRYQNSYLADTLSRMPTPARYSSVPKNFFWLEKLRFAVDNKILLNKLKKAPLVN